MIILCKPLIPNDRANRTPADIGTKVIATTVTDKFADAVIAPVITTVSTESNIDVSVLCYSLLFTDS